MSDYKFRLIPGDMIHLSLAKERFLKGLQTEQWAERHPDHFVVIHDHEALAFTETLSQTLFQLDEAAGRRIHLERVFIFYIGGPSVLDESVEGERIREQIAFIEDEVGSTEPSKAVATMNAAISPEAWPTILRELVRLDERELFAMIKELGLAIDERLLWVTEKIFHDTEKAFPDGLPVLAQHSAA